VDAVVSNPPYSANWDPENKELDPRFADYGLAPKSTADYAFLLHGLYHLNPQGLMTIVLPHGVLFRGGSEGLIRERLIEKRQIEAIIGLPADIFFGTGIPTIIMVLSKRVRHDDGILIIDASKNFIKDGKKNRLQASDIKRISDAVKERKDIENFCRVVSLEEIRANDYNLNIPRYVDTSNKPESWDIYASMFGGIPVNELNELDKFWKVFPSLQADLFESNNSSTLMLKNKNIREVVENNSDVVNYKECYKRALSSFDLWLSEELLEEPTLVNRSTEEDQIAKELFNRLEGIPLVDKYDAYQQLDNTWTIINSDLEEIIEKQSLDVARIVEPRMVEKNKKEVQVGWQGRIIPFELAQQELLANDLLAIKSLNNRLDAISSELDEIFESLTEEERASEITNDAEDNFNKSAFNKFLKTADTSEGTLGSKIKKANKLVTEEKQIGKQIKELTSELDNTTISLIQNLTDEQIKNLLEKKWITPLMTSILTLSNNAIENLVSSVTSLHKKYDTSLLDLENEIQSTELELCESLAQLTGNDADMQGIAELISLLGGEK
jgi:type I restriction-modification system, M subunit